MLAFPAREIESPMRPLLTSPAFQEAEARLDYVVQNRHQVAIVAGPVGSGKSTLLTHWAEHRRRTGEMVPILRTPGTHEIDFLSELAGQLRCETSNQLSLERLWFTIRQRLLAYELEQQTVVLVVDHAEEITTEIASVLLTLVRLHAGESGFGSLILSLDSQALPKLKHRVFQMADLKIELESWEPDDVASYVRQFQAEHADCPFEVTDATLEAIQAETDGNPKLIAKLLELSRLAAESAVVTPELIHEIRQEIP